MTTSKSAGNVAKLRSIVNVKDPAWGAKGDASTNDTAALYNAVQSDAQEIWIPAGTYMVEPTTSRTDPVLGETVRCAMLMKANQTITLDPAATIRSIAWVNGSANDEGGTQIVGLSVDNVRVRGGTLQGNWVPAGSYVGRDPSSQHGIHIATSTNATIEGVKAKEFWADGFTVSFWADQSNCNNSLNVNFINCIGDNCGRNGLSGVGWVGGSIIGGQYSNTVGPGPFNSPLAGIDLEISTASSLNGGAGTSQIKDIRIVGVRTTGNKYGINMIGSHTNINCRVANVTITGCEIDEGIILNGDSTSVSCIHNTITGNVIKRNILDESGVARSGIFLDNVQWNTISGNRLFDCLKHGIEIDADSHHNHITGNGIIAVSQTATNTYSGIYVAGDYNHIVGNSCRKDGSSNKAKYGIEVVAGATENKVLVNDLYLGGNTANYIDGGTNTLFLGGGGATAGLLEMGASTDFQLGKALVALGGGAAPTLGTVGGSGPGAAGQNSWARMVDSSGTAFWVPVWK